MESDECLLKELLELAECERANFDLSIKGLGDTVGIVDDLLDLYKRLGGLAKPPSDEAGGKVVMCVVHLLIRARSNLALGILNTLRAYRGNGLLFLRAAIEACAFAARIKKHKHMADAWLNAGGSPKEYEKFRAKFTKLFPADDSLLAELYEQFDRCSQMVHNSIYSMAGHFKYESNGPTETIWFNYFDMPTDHSIISVLYFTVDSHRRILRKFGDTLRSYMGGEDAQAWEVLLNAVEAKVDVHREKWKPHSAARSGIQSCAAISMDIRRPLSRRRIHWSAFTAAMTS